MNNPNFQQNAMGGQRPQAANGLQQFVQHFRGQLVQQKIPPGWQQSVSPEERGQLCQQFHSQYRLLKPDSSETEAMRAAVGFETQMFMNSANKNQYINNVKEKLVMMTQARQSQLSRMQGNLGPMNNAMTGMNGMPPAQMGIMVQPGPPGPRHGTPQQFNPAFPNAQLQRPMQVSPVPMSQGQSSMGMNNVSQNPQQPNPQQPANSQRTEGVLINQLARKLMDSCKPETRVKFEQDVAAWPEDKKQQLMSQNISPLFIRFRQHAEMLYKRGAINLQQGANGIPMQPGAQNRMPNQMGANQRQSNQDFDMNAIANQQMEAMRVQDQGATVVPASNNMNGAQMSGFPGQNPQQGQQQNAMAQRQAAETAAFQNSMQQRQQHAQQMQHAQAQAQAHAQLQQQQRAAQARNSNQLNQSQLLQGLNGGLNLPPSSQSPGPMSMLNRPMHPPGQPGPPTPQQQPQNHVPVMTPRPGQMNNDPQVSALLREAQQRANAIGAHNQPLSEANRLAMMPPGLEPHMRAQLLEVSELQFRSLIQTHMRNLQQRNNAMAQFPGLQPNQGPPNPMFNQQMPPQPGMPNQMMGVNMGRPGLNLGQQMPGAAQQAQMGQRSTQGQLNPQQQQRIAIAQNMLRQNPGIIQATDNRPWSLNNLSPQIRQNIPPDVKTWGQLKQWTAQNPALMPGITPDKLVLQQVLHYQDFIKQQNGNGQPQAHNNMSGLAPPAQMTPNPGAVRTPQPPLNMAALQATPQEIQNLRQRLPPQNANATDEQLRSYIMNQKVKAHQVRQGHLMQQQQQQHQSAMLAQQNQLRPGQQQQQQLQQQQLQQQQQQQHIAQPMSGQPQPPIRPPTAQSQNAQATPQAKAGTRPQPPAQPTQPSTAVNKGVKRPNEDATEAQADASAKTAVPQAPAMAPTRSGAGHNFTPEQMSRMNPTQQAQVKAQLLKAQDASNAAGNKVQQQQQQQPSAVTGNEEIRQRLSDPATSQALGRIIDEVERSMAPRPYVQLPQQIRGPLERSLQEQLDKLKKLDQALRVFHASYGSAENTEGIIRQVAHARALVFQQINTQDGTLKDQVTMTPDEFRIHMRTLMNFYAKVAQRIASIQSAARQPQPQQGPDAPLAQLNAANLKIVEQQQRHNKAPSAPTTDRPPFALGDQSARGAPTYFEGAKAVTNLVLPDKKRTKLDPVSQTSTPGPKASPRIGTGKGHSPELTRQPPPKQIPQRPTFQCGAVDCEYSIRGFETQAELESHQQVHVKIENPLQYALESMADYLDVDLKTGEPRVDPSTAKRPTKAAPATSRATQPVKPEQTSNTLQNVGTPAGAHVGTPAGAQAAATPMARIPTQPTQTVTNFLKTPQTMAKVATPGSGAHAKATPTSMPRPAPKEETITAPEPVKEEEQPLLPISLLDYSYEDTFAALDANGTFTVLDLKDEDPVWALRSRPASPTTTPDSSAKDTPSTRTSDISENDNLHINLDMDMPDAWAMGFNGNALPMDFQISEDIQALGAVLPPMTTDDMMLFPTFGDGMIDLEALEKSMDSMGGGFDGGMLGML